MKAHVLFVAFLAAVGLVAAAAPASPNGNVANGKALYVSVGCYQCHGFVGQGGAAGPRLNPPLAYEPWLLQLRTPRFVMPPYSPVVLTDQQAADIYAYTATFPPPVDPATIRLLQ
jgi:ubiquinol-cytochrome c reductase cytochrome c subunit